MDLPFLGYAHDCIVNGTVTLREQRMADLVRDRELIAVRDMEVDALSDGRRLHHPALDLHWHELVLLAATGPQGDPSLRFYATRRHPVHAQVGPYEIAGYLHAPVAVDPFAFARHRSTIPLTEAAVAFRVGKRTEIHRHEALLLNGAYRTHLASVADGVVRHLVSRANVDPFALQRRWGGESMPDLRGNVIRLGSPERATA
ncbi:MAG: hypothetical protein WCK58_17970 [Chloroflexota bacterium]